MKFALGDVVVPRDARFPKGALVVDGYDEKGLLLAHQIGGGIELHIDDANAETLRVVDEAERAQAIFQQSTFRLPDSEDLFEGWTDGELCNGWEMPRFEIHVCQEIVQAKGEDSVWYDSRGDAFEVVSESEEQSYPAEKITTVNGTQLTTYAVGAGVWMWERVALG